MIFVIDPVLDTIINFSPRDTIYNISYVTKSTHNHIFNSYFTPKINAFLKTRLDSSYYER